MGEAASGVISALPRMPLQQMAEAWRNVITVLLRSEGAADQVAARLVLEAIHAEWAHRRLNPHPDDSADKWLPDAGGRRPQSPLAAHGYKVGRRSEMSAVLRQELLRRCVEEPLMPAFSASTLQAWGPPRTPKRLKRILLHIDDQLRPNAPQSDKQDAVADWRADLRHLHRLYADRVELVWPDMERRDVRFVG